jgi:hypothetical protein
MAGDRSDQDCLRHHAVLRKSGFLAPSELSLTSRGFGEGGAGEASLCRPESGVAAKNPGAVSALATPFPGRNWPRRQR